ncbi:uncharacterized protein N7443_009801 [Penicillium atrosanguineum]|uniref:uncharacterized protein n=1 Tax=Penicillium atrosanguineum TaxID=1132637 RepID=UPI0023950DCB|nr:uncharacterized protein N7443_009801 [Penicillium atrosanguineum]KAJ5289548.1 hypothetical protein N7443_009801 [Penicillium atrosanguineum]
MATIRKVVITEFGDVNVVKIVETNCSPPAPGFVQIATEYSGFTAGDISMRKVLTKYDAQAELVSQPEKYCFKVPDGLDHQQVTALICDWSTAYAMTTQAAKVTKGQRVFIHGLSDAVGCGLIILCSLLGAEVCGTVSERNHEFVRAYGVTPFVYTDKKWTNTKKALDGIHAVFDPLV